ncbi:MAG: NADH-quinone oxidoreductase subunit L [Desulfuromonadales bacterium]|nr:NADH-quinone oxidoreductase subunit L [Desulfuromonadales bacterium]
MMETMMISVFALPIICGVAVLVLPKKTQGALSILATTANLALCLELYGRELLISRPWAGFGMLFELRLYHFSSFILAAAAGFGFLVSLYSLYFMRNRSHANQYYSYLLISLGMVNGAVLADNLVLMLFFWEGLLCTIFGFIAIGNKEAFRSAIKAFVLIGVSDILMMVGIGMTGFLSGTMTMSRIHLTPDSVLGGAAFLLLVIGATSKAGSMPFHSWIPDAALDAPLPFMALMPAALEKLLGIYFLARITLDLFTLTPQSWLSPLLMTLGVVTILLAVMMALIQKDYKRLLSYHAISQVGYMILGIGTAIPVGIVGGIFHMINHAMYKSCLFLTGGSVETQTGTTDLHKLGGIGRQMPITFTCFIIAAAAISGVPPFNGFFSKELVYDGALERHWIFYAGALAGSFLTAASFLKLGHAAFLGSHEDGSTLSKIKEAPLSMLIPMITIAGGCVLFGVANPLPINNLIVPIIGPKLAAGHHFSGFPQNRFLVVMTVLVLLGAWLNHIYGVRKSGKGVGASDHIHYSPLLQPIYDRAEKRYFDPYDIGMKIVQGASRLAWWIDRANDWLFNVLAVRTAQFFSRSIRELHNGSYATYMVWIVIGAILMGLYMNV